MRGRLLIGAVLTVALATVTACSASGHPAHPPNPVTAATAPTLPGPAACPSVLRRIVHRRSSGGTVSVHTEGSSGLLRCTYRVRAAAPGACTGATVLINTAPSAFTAFNRWTTETGQNAMWTDDPALNPRPVAGIGILAEWVPKTQTFETATKTAWIAVYLDCPAHSKRALPLGEALGRAALAAA